MNKYSKKMLYDYITGNEIDEYDIDELENAPEMGASSVRTRPRIPKDLRTLVNMLPLGHTN